MNMEAENTNVVDAQTILQQTEEKKEAASFIDFKMVTFALGGKDYAIDIMHIKEIAKAGRFTYVPNTQPFVLGVYNLRGEIIPILDLRLFFNVPAENSTVNNLRNLLIMTIDDQTFGLVVDKIDKVIGVRKSTIQPPHPLFGDINIKYINGVVESNNRLYVLLDVVRIFSMREITETQEEKVASMEKVQGLYSERTKVANESQPAVEQQPVQMQNSVQSSEVTSAPSAAPVVDESKIQTDIKFIAESLKNYKNFELTEVNQKWMKFRYGEWNSETGKSQIQTLDEADDFLKTFWSSYSDKWWSEEYADNIRNILPENSAKQIVVWNPGCGKGIEAYSLACILHEKYPEAKIKIYAQDIDLLNVSNASLLSVPESVAGEWYGSYLSKKANNEYTFNSDIKDSILFEYHDCRNTNVIPMVDIIFARDVLSFCDNASLETVVTDFQEKLKGNGIIIIGDNEVLPSKYGFGEKSFGAVMAYTKD